MTLGTKVLRRGRTASQTPDVKLEGHMGRLRGLEFRRENGAETHVGELSVYRQYPTMGADEIQGVTVDRDKVQALNIITYQD